MGSGVAALRSNDFHSFIMKLIMEAGDADTLVYLNCLHPIVCTNTSWFFSFPTEMEPWLEQFSVRCGLTCVTQLQHAHKFNLYLVS
jgi:hypothetical protein